MVHSTTQATHPPPEGDVRCMHVCAHAHAPNPSPTCCIQDLAASNHSLSATAFVFDRFANVSPAPPAPPLNACNLPGPLLPQRPPAPAKALDAALLDLAGAPQLAASGGVSWAVNERQAEALVRSHEVGLTCKACGGPVCVCVCVCVCNYGLQLSDRIT